jgi:predicted RNA binding protein YcfA (HicA-like mRNA interferase family)
VPELPKLSGKEIIKILNLLGFKVVRQKGSHVVLRKENLGCVIPMHKEVAIGTLKSALKQANISTDDFILKYKNR